MLDAPSHQKQLKSQSRSHPQYYASDFETTSYDDYKIDGYTRVYLWAIQEISSSEIDIGDTIDQFIAYLSLLPSESSVYFHNLKFDGKFIVDYLLKHEWKHGGEEPFHFTTVINDMKEWFRITLYFEKSYVIIKDSLKKFPGMSIATLAKTFKIDEKPPLTLDKRRGPNYVANEEEIIRVKGDVRILAHALRESFIQGMKRDTASSDAFEYFKATLVALDSKKLRTFDEIQNSPNFQEEARHAFHRLFPSYYRSDSADSLAKCIELDHLFRQGYYGGLCYLNPKYQTKILKNIDVFDRNSQYPTVMHNYPLPIGRIRNREPRKGDLYIIQIEAIFCIKPNHIPFLQSKTDIYRQNQVLLESDAHMKLVLPSPLYELFHESYDVLDEIVLGKWVFESKKGIFDNHIKHFYNIKSKTTDPGERIIAKLRLNSLYGKFGQRHNQQDQIPELQKDNIIHYVKGNEYRNNIQTYLPVAMFTTAYGKCDLVRAANKFGDRFVYCDTDSIHAIHHPDNMKLLPINNKKLGYWKHEGCHPRAKYIRPKVYIHGDENFNVTEIKAAGAPIACKANMTFETLKPGVSFKGKLLMKTVPGGCVLQETTYKVDI